jgi:putative pyruvate formate lyase activating enzyme
MKTNKKIIERKILENKIKRIDQALDNLASMDSDCSLCPRECHVNRQKGELGFCKIRNRATVSHVLRHYGEEPVLSGYFDCSKNQSAKSRKQSGSGTIFFTGCNLKCLYCQNYQLSWLNQGQPYPDSELAQMMLNLQRNGALNINLVSPTHVILPILRALKIAYDQGLELPVVYNSNGFEKKEVLENLEGIIDIYLPDLKYFSSQTSSKFSDAPDYFQYASQALIEMQGQQPQLILNNKEIALKGLIIRHLILPGQKNDAFAILNWIAQSLSLSVPLSLMSQYYPCYKAPPEIQKTITQEEYQEVLSKAEDIGFEYMFIQPEPFESNEHLLPDFSLPHPFPWDTP